MGLGNPGREYEPTRHNAGFWLVEELARRHGGAFRLESRFSAELARVRLAGARSLAAEAQDYMNHSGRVTAAVAAFYKVEAPADPGGARRAGSAARRAAPQAGGGAGGHNGLSDLIAHSAPDFWRLRIGIGHPGAKELVTPWLLTRHARQ